MNDFPDDDRWLQQVAAEMNLSETAFLTEIGGGQYRLRWFTPVEEVDLCGHATLASAHVLWQTGVAHQYAQLHFHTLSGILTAKRMDSSIELNFPVETPSPCDAPAQLIAALHGLQPVTIYKNRLDYIAELPSETAVRDLRPDFLQIKQLPARGLVVTSRSDTEDFDFVARCFFSPVGLDEDLVTGSAHCGLAPYWKDRLGKSSFRAAQVSSRGGTLHLQLTGDRVLIRGQAVIVVKGLLLK
ncbi:PhzF family phenazine biosynthesis protein [Paenibacillus xerothermodurans]|uniref:PhzF family phenazine biosynthesis protein n=1 Tax=Paenibacillus xerothermodurans TaxID=1977292 RepID=UPI00311D2C77